MIPRPLPGPTTARSRTVKAVLAAVLLTTPLYLNVRPAYADVAVGSSAGDFLQFEIGGRPAGMGGAQVGSAAGITAQFWNPAGLSSLEQSQVGAMHATWLGDLNYEWIGYARPLGPKLGVGSVSVAYFHMPSISGVDEFDNPTGEFKVYDMAMTVGLARPVGKGLSVGANAKLIRQTLATVSATGTAVDFGAALNLAGSTFGAVVQNLGPSLSFDGASYPLPRQVRFGASRAFWDGRVLLASDYNMPSDYFDDVRVGTEVRAHPNVSLRVGYRRLFGTSDDPGNGMSYGMGIHFRQLNVDYAMTPSDAFDDVHRLSFGYSFGSGATTEKAPKPKKPEETKPAPPPAPTGPPIIAQAKPAPSAPKQVQAKRPETKPEAHAPKAPAPSAVAPAAAPPASMATVTPAAPPPAPPAETSKPAPAVASEYLVVLPWFQSKETAEAEVKALELLGFKTKNARISKDPKRGGYVITLERMKSKESASELAAALSRMSFRATVDVAQK